MDVLLIYTTLIPALLFLPLFVINWRKKKLGPNSLNAFITGGASWSATALVIFLPSLLLYNKSTIEAYRTTLQENLTLTFWLVVIFLFITEVFRFLGLKQFNFFTDQYKFSILFGLGWGIGEIITRFLFFFDDSYTGLQIAYFFLLIILIDIGISIVLQRAGENTKYYIFNVFSKLCIELGIYGLFGNSIASGESLGILTGVVILLYALATLSQLAKKYPMED